MSLSLLNQSNRIDLSNGIFRFMGQDASIIPDHENPLFLANDIAKILGYKDTTQSIFDHVDPDYKTTWGEIQKKLANIEKGGVELTSPFSNLAIIEKSIFSAISTRIYNQTKTVFITEAGLYELICSSKMEAAKEFKKWIFKDVIPTIRKTGSYGKFANEQNQPPNQLLLENEEIKQLRLDKENLEKNMVLNET